MPVSLRSIRAGAAGLIAFLAASLARAALTGPVYFDTAPQAAAREEQVALTPADHYDAAKGYGWTIAPADTFVLPPHFGGVRAAPLLDGVMGLDFTLRLDLAPGRWTVIAFLDDGYANAHTDRIEVNGQPIAHNPRTFGVSSEPEVPPINRYRVAQFVVTANGPVNLRFQQAAPGARLLALQLLPMDWAETDVTRWLRRQVEDAGRHDFKAPLDILRNELERHGRRLPEATAACAYWKAQLDLLAEAEQWHRMAGWDEVSSRTRSSMFTRYWIALSLLDPLVEHPDGDAFLLRDRARWMRARLLYWLYAEQHFAADMAAFKPDIAEMRKKYPGDRLVAMYAGEKFADTCMIDFKPLAGAPAWSTAQYEALQRLRDVAYHWIDERQIPNGEFGGKTDDDVELLRWWPVLMLSGDTKVRAGFGKLAEGMWFSPKIHLGFAREPRDVEHSAEYVSDTLPMMALITRDPVWIDRLGWSYRHMRDLWTGRNTHGDLLFKSAWLGATQILTEPPRNRDLSMNARAAKTVRYHAWLKADAAAAQLLHDWSLSWAKAAAGTDKGKPKGLFPASLRWPDGVVNGDEPTWFHANMMWDYFNWEGDGRLYDQLLFSWIGTRDDRLLAPLRDTLAFLEKTAPNASAAEGSPEWAAATLRDSEEFWNVVVQWRLETGDTSHDGFLKENGPPYLRYRLTGDAAGLGEKIESSLLGTLRYNRPMRTSEVLFTDRVYVSPNGRGEGGTDLLSAMLTGGHSAQGMSPYYHVAWEQAPVTFTALVTSTGTDHVAADLYLHQKEKAGVVARFFRLAPGNYRLTVKAGSKVLVERNEAVAGPDHRAPLELPGGELVSVSIKRTGS